MPRPLIAIAVVTVLARRWMRHRGGGCRADHYHDHDSLRGSRIGSPSGDVR